MKLRYHARLFVDAGFLANERSHQFRLTNAGHDYLNAIRDEGIWSRTKAAVAETGGSATLELIKNIATGFVKKKLSQHTGLDL